jgi:phosphatidate cytidylyltransferase
LFERISPKKSWEGFIGGALAALGSGYVFSLYIPQLNLLEWLIFSEIIVVFGTFGDLIESLMKRTVNIKDSGNVLPGHGGLLDRFDSMILAAPVIYIYLSLLFHHV